MANVGTDVALGNAHLGTGALGPAIAAYQAALARHPGSFRGHANLAEALRRQGRLAEATQHLEVARRLLPGHPKLAELAERLTRDRQEAEVRRPE
jgi:tetratricopeptide (TPR) repeat protein